MRALKRVSGTRRLKAEITFDDVISFVTYPTATTWQADLMLEPDRTEYKYTFDNQTWYTLTINEPETEFSRLNSFNVLDDWGLKLDSPRLPEEDNVAFKERLLDVMVHRGGPTYQGLSNAISRDLGLTYSDQALVIAPATSVYTGAPHTNIIVGVDSTDIFVYGPALFVSREKAFVSPVFNTVTPSYDIAANLSVTDASGNPLEFEYDSIRNKIFIKELDDYNVVYLTYFYMLKVNRIGVTLSEIESSLEALQTLGGETILSVSVASGFGSYLGDNLSRSIEANASESNLDAAGNEVEGIPVRWTDLKIESVWDPLIQERERTWSGSLFGTRFDSAHQALVKTAKQTWGTAVADESIWGNEDIPLHGGQCLDTVLDMPLGFWEHPLTAVKYDTWYHPAAIYRGVLPSDILSGPGHHTDLLVVIDKEEPSLYTEEEEYDSVSEFSEKAEPTGTDALTGGTYLP